MKVDESGQSASGLAWVKSSYSSGAGGECVEVASATRSVHVRDSKRPEGPTLAVGADRWAAFVAFAARD
ncbi:DUF397 domain-containing protein [Streptomyces sp. NPDC058674]|uniref:DUF397 domain-containing protein n=1 Tax=Streptomyces sp. NPDC058674 TaxID=3346592 RepID=UPI00365512B7